MSKKFEQSGREEKESECVLIVYLGVRRLRLKKTCAIRDRRGFWELSEERERERAQYTQYHTITHNEEQ
jgi:hypothetical protein